MQIKLKMIVPILLSICLFAVGCSTHRINTLTINRASGAQQWDINNPILQGNIELIEVRQVKFKQEGELLFIYLLLLNKRNYEMGTQIKVNFYDQNGYQLENPWGYKPVMLESKQETWFKFMAPTTEDKITKIKIFMKEVTIPDQI